MEDGQAENWVDRRPPGSRLWLKQTNVFEPNWAEKKKPAGLSEGVKVPGGGPEGTLKSRRSG